MVRQRIVPIVFILMALLVSSIAQAKVAHQEGTWIYSISGEITSKDTDQVRTALQGINRAARPLFELNSPGGDVYAAMEIGRLIRKTRAKCIIPIDAKCHSACIFVLAGAVDRDVYGKVAIHRPYSSYVGKRDYQSAEKEYRRTETAVRAYLREMNLPEQLFEAMVRVPPQEIHVLNREETKAFGLTGIDPVEQEVRDATLAAVHGITKREYLSRKAQIDQACPHPRGLSTRQIEEWSECQEAFLYGVPIQVYKARMLQAEGHCPGFKSDSEQFWPCAWAVLRGER